MSCYVYVGGSANRRVFFFQLFSYQRLMAFRMHCYYFHVSRQASSQLITTSVARSATCLFRPFLPPAFLPPTGFVNVVQPSCMPLSSAAALFYAIHLSYHLSSLASFLLRLYMTTALAMLHPQSNSIH